MAARGQRKSDDTPSAAVVPVVRLEEAEVAGMPTAEVPEEFGTEREDPLAELEAFVGGARAMDALETLSAELRRRFQEAVEARREIDDVLLECMYRRDGVYPPDVAASLKAQGGSQAFENITEGKCAAAEAEIDVHVLYGPKRAWSIEPTPLPELSDENFEMAAEAAAREAAESGAEVTDDLLERTIARQADRAASRMTKVIEDQLKEGGWEDAFKSFAHNVATFPVAGFLGPVPKRQLRVLASPRGVETLVDYAMSVEAVDPFGVYPAGMSAKPEDGDFFYRRLISDDAAVELGNMGNLLPGSYEKAYAAKGGGVADTSLDQALAEHEKQQGKAGDTFNPDGKHELVYWWHRMTRREMAGAHREELGAEEAPEERIPCMGLMLNGVVITAEENWDPRGIPQVHLCAWRQKPGSVFGKSVAALMANAQDNRNVARRALNNNIHFSAQNQRIAYPDLLTNPRESLLNNYPGQTFVAKLPQSPGDNRKPIEPVATPNFTTQLLQALSQAETLADDTTGLFPQSFGSNRQVGPAKTLGGYELMVEGQSKMTKLALTAIDGCIQGLIGQFWLWNMLTPGNEDAKGDQKVVCTGTKTLFQRSDLHERLQSVYELFTKDESAASVAKSNAVAVLLRRIVELRELDADDLVKTDDELADEAAGAVPPMPPEMVPPGMPPVESGVAPEVPAAPEEAGGEPLPPEGGELPPEGEESPEMVRARADMARAEAALQKVEIEREKLIIAKAEAVSRLRERERDAALRRRSAAQGVPAGGAVA